MLNDTSESLQAEDPFTDFNREALLDFRSQNEQTLYFEVTDFLT